MIKKLLRISLAIVFVGFVAFGADAQATIKKITSSGKLKVGMTTSQPPFNVTAKDGSIIGYEADIAKMLAESMGVELEIVKKPFSELLPALKKGEVHAVMSGMTITPKRNLEAAFVGPYLLSGKSILTKSATLAQADETADVNARHIALTALAGTTSEEFVKMFAPESSYKPAKDYDEAVKLVMDGTVDAMVADYPICVLSILRNPEAGLVTLTEPLTIEPIGMALPPDDPQLQNFVTNFLTRLQLMGVLQEMEMAWFESGSWLIQVD